MSNPIAEAPVVPAAVTPSPSVTPPAESPAPANQAAADAAAAAAAKPSTPATPPAEVAYTLALPKDAQIEAGAVERLTSFAKEHKLAPEIAQKALDLADAEVKADRVKQNESAAESFKTMATKQWVEDVKADAEFGGEKYLVTVEEVKRAADKFLTDADREVLNTTGWGNHPMLVKMFARIGRSMANDKLVNSGASGSGAARDNSLEARASRLYVNDGKGPSA